MAEAIRGRVSPYTFLGRFQQQPQQQEENAQTNVAVRQNQIALSNVNISLVRITEQVNILSSSLQGISNQIRESSAIEGLKEQQKARQEKILAEQQIREGKESQIEKKIQTALVTPIQKVGAKAQGTLFNLTRFFNILLGGFLLNRILDEVSKLSKDGKLSLKNLGDAIVKDLGVVSGIFLAVNGGFTLALNSVGRLAGLLTRVAIRGLLLTPINLVFGIAGKALTSLKNKIKNVPRIPPSTSPTTGGGGRRQGGNQTRQGGNQQQSGRQSGGGFPVGASTAMTLINFLGFNQSIGESASGPLAGGLLSMLGGARLRIPMFLIGSFLGPEAYNTYREDIESVLPALGMNKDDLFNMISGRKVDRNITPETDGDVDVSVINVEGNGGNRQQTNAPAAAGSATYLPSISSNNPSNFYLMYSKTQYNVVA